MSLGAEGYLLKPLSEKAVRTLLARILPPTPRHVEVRTFGRFDVFAGGMPVYFQNAKAKELLALLVDKRGTVTMELAVNVLWDDRHYDERVKQLYRKAVSYLHRLFQEVEPELFVSNRGSCYVNCERFACDYYDLLKGRPEALAAFNGEYMFEYPWAEATLAQIENIALANGGNRRPEE
jgi:two-component SAPR family response regulator